MRGFLDLLRITATLGVFLGHANFHWFFGSSTLGPQNGQDYVIVFFVLSGFVITWSVDKKSDLSFNRYLFARLTRLWTVVIPALVIGYALDCWGKSINANTYVSIFSGDYLLPKYLLSASFLNESWFLSVRPGSNSPLWSLSYEFFYYLIFGLIILLPTLKKKIIAGAVASLVAGPKVLLLFPCWLVGFFAYKACKHLRTNVTISLLLIIPSAGFLIHRMTERWSHWHPWDIPGLGVSPLFYSAKFLDDYSTATALGLLIFGCSRWFQLSDNRKTLSRTILHHLAGCSFSVYVFHFPIMAFIGALSAAGNISFLSLPTAILLVLMLCYALAFIFERPLNSYRSIALSSFSFASQKCGIHS